MKAVFLLAGSLVAALAMPLQASADEVQIAEQAKVPGMSGAKVPTSEPTVKKMQDNVRKMQEQLERLTAATNDVDAQNILAEHMLTLHENMMLGHTMDRKQTGLEDPPEPATAK